MHDTPEYERMMGENRYQGMNVPQMQDQQQAQPTQQVQQAQQVLATPNNVPSQAGAGTGK